MDEATSGGWNASKKRKRFLIATVTEGYGSSTKCFPVGNLCWHPHDRTADWARFWGRNDGPQ